MVVPNEKELNMQRSFWHFEMAIRLWNAIDLKKIPDEIFRESIIIEDGGGILVLDDALFKTQEARLSAIQALVGDAFGRTASALSEYVDFLNPEKPTEQQKDLRDFIYMIRCAFSHEIGAPQWEVRGPYKRSLSIEGISYDMDELNGNEFAYEDVGGCEVLHKIRGLIPKYFA